MLILFRLSSHPRYITTIIRISETLHQRFRFSGNNLAVIGIKGEWGCPRPEGAFAQGIQQCGVAAGCAIYLRVVGCCQGLFVHSC